MKKMMMMRTVMIKKKIRRNCKTKTSLKDRSQGILKKLKEKIRRREELIKIQKMSQTDDHNYFVNRV
jgi:hypothetical protein